MGRAIWTGNLAFGLVTVPVGVYAAVEDRSVHFNQLQRGTSDRVRMQRVNERTGDVVPYGDIVKGYEVDDGEYVVVEPSELDELTPGRSKTIEISGFVDLDQVEPAYFAATYFLGPKSDEYGRVYELLRQALGASHRAGIATFVMHNRQQLTAIKAEERALVLHTMHYADELRDPVREIPTLPEKVEVAEREMAAARQLIEMLSMDWDPQLYRNEYQERVRDLVEAKQAGREVVVSPRTSGATNVVDLMDALQRSIESGRRSPARADSAGERPSGRAGDRAGTAPSKGRGQGKNRENRDNRDIGKARDGGRGRAADADPGAGAQATAGIGIGTGAGTEPDDLTDLNKAQLYARASELDISGRSTMTRDELRAAVANARRAGQRRSA